MEKANKFSDISGAPFQKTSEAWTEKFPTTSEPPPENVGQQKLKVEPSRMERSPQFFLQKTKVLKYIL